MQKIPVTILGATGSVGQKFIELLNDHPWFEIVSLCASERSAGKPYREAVSWFQASPLPKHIANMIVEPCTAGALGRIAFSGLDAEVAGDIETAFAKAGYAVISNSKNHRMDEDVPLLVPEVNPEQAKWVTRQTFGSGGMIVTNPNCTTVGLVMALKPLVDAFGVEIVSVVSMQALSGAGYPGVSSLDIIDNVIPHIGGEEKKMETEPLKIFGVPLTISAQCNRVAVVDGHMECVSVRLSKQPIADDIITTWRSFRSAPQELELPSAPQSPVHYLDGDFDPQPRKHRLMERGMAVCVGRLRPCSVLGWKFAVLSHNTIRGAAGGAILNAELLVKQGYIA